MRKLALIVLLIFILSLLYGCASMQPAKKALGSQNAEGSGEGMDIGISDIEGEEDLEGLDLQINETEFEELDL